MSEVTKTFFSASFGKQPLLDNDVFNHVTTDDGNKVLHLNLSRNLTTKKKRHMYYFLRISKTSIWMDSLTQAPSQAPILKQIQRKSKSYQAISKQ